MSKYEVIAVDVSINFVDFISKEVESLAGKNKDITVIFPNIRPLRFVEKNLSLKSLLNVQVFSMGDFVRDVVINNSDNPPVIQDEIDRLIMILKILKSNRQLYKKLGNEDSVVFPWVRRLSSLFSEIDTQLIENVKDFEYFDQTVEEARLLLENLNSLYLSYRHEVEEKNVSYGGDLYKRCVEILNSEIIQEMFKNRVFLFAGFSYLTNSEKKIIELIKESFETYIYFHTDTSNRFHRIKNKKFEVYGIYNNWIKGVQWGKKAELKKGFEFEPNIRFFESYDVHSEVRLVVKVLKEVLNNIKSEKDLKNPKKIGIILPDSKTLFPLLFYISKLYENRLPKNITMGFPLSKTGFGDFLERLFKTLVDIERNHGKKVYVPVFLKLLKSEILTLFDFKAEKSYTDILFNFLVENNIVFLDFEDMESVFKEEKELGRFVQVVYRNLIKPFLEAKDFGGLHNAFQKMYLLLNKDVLSDLNYRYDAIVLDYFLTTVVSRLDSLKNQKDINLKFNQRLFYSIINILSKSISIPFEGNPLEGIQIMGMLESRSLSFDYLFVLDVNEGILPGTEKIDPLIPESLKFELGLSSFKDREKLIKYNFFRLIDSSKNVFVFYQSGQTTLEKKTRSRFVEQLLLEKSFNKKQLESDEIVKSQIVLNSPLILKGKVDENSPCKYKEGIEKTEWIQKKIESILFEGNGVSATFIDDYLKCPYMFYLKRISGIERRQILEESQRADKVGSLVHHVLEKGFGRYKGEKLEKGIVEQVRSKVISEILYFVDNGSFKEFDVKGVEEVIKYIKNLEKIKKDILKKVVEFRLNRLFDFFISEIKKVEKVKLLDVEKEIKVENFVFKGKKIPFIGKIDRIEEINDEITRIIDYKTGKYAKTPVKSKFSELMLKDIKEGLSCVEELKQAINSIQLPFYIYLYSKSKGINEPFKIESCLYLLGESDLKNIKKDFAFSGLPTFSGLSDFEAVLSLVFAHMLNSELILSLPGESCRYCDYRHFCVFSN